MVMVMSRTRALRSDLVAAIRRWQPAALFSHDPERPWPPYLSHCDHRVVGPAARGAVYPLARDRLAFAEQLSAGLEPHAVHEDWLFASAAADRYVDIARGFERKLAARRAHVSQTPDAAALAESWRERARSIVVPVGLEIAEAYTVLQLD